MLNLRTNPWLFKLRGSEPVNTCCCNSGIAREGWKLRTGTSINERSFRFTIGSVKKGKDG